MCTQSRVAALHSRGGTSLAWYAVVDPKRKCLVRHSPIYSLIVLPGRAIGCPPSARSRTRWDRDATARSWPVTACGRWRRSAALRRSAHISHQILSEYTGNRGCRPKVPDRQTRTLDLRNYKNGPTPLQSNCSAGSEAARGHRSRCCAITCGLSRSEVRRVIQTHRPFRTPAGRPRFRSKLLPLLHRPNRSASLASCPTLDGAIASIRQPMQVEAEPLRLPHAHLHIRPREVAQRVILVCRD